MNNSVSFYLLINLIFGYLFVKVESFLPVARNGHSAITVDNKLYFFGGADANNNYLSEVFYLDFSKSFNISVPSWNDISNPSIVPLKNLWITNVLIDNKNNPIIYLIGGTMDKDDSFAPMVHTFNPN